MAIRCRCVTSTSILYKFLKSQNALVDYYIPNRFEEGYGFSQNSVEKVLDMGVDLVVTVDCGTTSIEDGIDGERNRCDSYRPSRM